ncbi:MAG: TOBE domain-containing protein, partial [Rhodobacteraceae bacterium]|nr:TOBE domain-containing protein [Paracoccaceae bacterium]
QEEALTMSDRIAVMQAGRILQLGSPHEIYHAPAERFVADFIGDTNFLDLAITAIDGTRATLTLPGGTPMTADLPDGLSPVPGDRVTTVVRPEQALIVPEAEADLTGTLQDAVFFGTDTHLHLTLDDGQGFTLRRQNTANDAEPPKGARLGLRVSPGALRILRG